MAQATTFPELARTPAEAEKARASHDKLVAGLRANQIAVKGEMNSGNNPFGKKETVRYRGGPFDGLEGQVIRCVPVAFVPAANPDASGAPYVQVEYRRTPIRADDGLSVYQYQQPADQTTGV